MPTRPVVLIVDDEPDIARSLQAVIELELQYEALATESAEDALSILRSLEQTPPDLLIVDYRMPRVDGVQFLLRARKILPDVPAMMVTAYADVDLVVRAARDLRVARFLRKPIKPQVLVTAVREVVSPRWAARQRNAAFDRSKQAR